MLRSLSATAACAVLSTLAAAAPATALTIHFESFSHGDIVAAPSGGEVGYTLRVENFNRAFDAAIAFDTGVTGSLEPDLELDPATGWSAGNLARTGSEPHPGEDLGNILVIQGNGACDTAAGVCSKPEDEGGRPAGLLDFRLDGMLAVGFSFDLVDVESGTMENGQISFHLLGVGEAPGSGNQTASFDFVQFLGLGQNVVFGNNSANHVELDTNGLYNTVLITMGGSGGIDNLDFQNLQPIPEPGPFVLLSLGLAGLTFSARRRKG